MAKAVAKIEEASNVVTLQTPEQSWLQTIERLAPAVGIEGVRELMTMRREERAHHAKAAYLAALADMQAELPTVEKKGQINKNEKDERGAKTGNQVAMTKYAKWEDVVDAITPVLHKHGFSLQFRISQPTPDRLVTTAVLGHKAGHSEETSISLPLDSSGAKNNVQGWGSSASYGKRYTAFALLNIAARGEDDDGKAAGDKIEYLDAPEAERIKKELDDVKADIGAFCDHFGLDSIDRIPAAKQARIMEAIAKKRKQVGK